MPITPFHFGPGAALHALAPRHVSFLAFCAANVLIDIESLVNLISGRHPVHAFFHSYVGATLVIPAVAFLFIVGRWLTARFPLAAGWQGVSLRQVLIGAALGAYSHVLLDSVMHPDIRPLLPFDSSNALLDAVSLRALHLGCVFLGLLGAIGVLLRRQLAK